MSKESLEWLNNNTLIGFTAQRGNAWHRKLSLVAGGLDNHYSGAIPQADILARLFNWTAQEKTLYVDSGIEGIMMPVDDRKALVHPHTGHVFGIHSDGYKVHDYAEWLVNHLSALVGSQAQFANAGLLKKGALAWVQIEMPNNVDAPEGIEIRPFILATTSLDGSMASTFKTGYTNVVCDNTFEMFMGEASEVYKMRHTRNSEFNLTNAATALNTLHLTAERAVADISRLIEVKVSATDWQRFIEAHVPFDDFSASKRALSMGTKKREALTGLWNADERVAPWNGTAWGVVQAVNTYNEHLAIVRNAERSERKMTRAITGDVGKADRAAVMTLSDVLGRDLISA